MVGNNQRKLQVLKYIDCIGEVTAHKVAAELGIKLPNSQKRLVRYWNQGLLRRRIIDKKTRERTYTISQKGLDRIEWLKGLKW